MKYLAFSLALLGSLITCHSHAESTGVDQQAIEDYLKSVLDYPEKRQYIHKGIRMDRKERKKSSWE